jgi:hypothetical protein
MERVLPYAVTQVVVASIGRALLLIVARLIGGVIASAAYGTITGVNTTQPRERIARDADRRVGATVNWGRFRQPEWWNW